MHYWGMGALLQPGQGSLYACITCKGVCLKLACGSSGRLAWMAVYIMINYAISAITNHGNQGHLIRGAWAKGPASGCQAKGSVVSGYSVPYSSSLGTTLVKIPL